MKHGPVKRAMMPALRSIPRCLGHGHRVQVPGGNAGLERPGGLWPVQGDANPCTELGNSSGRYSGDRRGVAHHGHLDHVGYLLVKAGFGGRILATGPTIEIATIILKDTAKIQEETAERANREGYSKHKPAQPLYDLADVDRTMPLFHEVKEGAWHALSDTIKARFQYVGHIIGATFIDLDIAGKRIVFSGDVGRQEDILLFPQAPERADVLLIDPPMVTALMAPWKPPWPS